MMQVNFTMEGIGYYFARKLLVDPRKQTYNGTRCLYFYKDPFQPKVELTAPPGTQGENTPLYWVEFYEFIGSLGTEAPGEPYELVDKPPQPMED